jgi:hypothetical protein
MADEGSPFSRNRQASGCARKSMTDQTSLTRARAFHDPAYPSPENLSTEQAALIADLNRMMASGKID